MAKLSPREWWQNRQQQAQERQDARQAAQIPVLDLRNSEWATQDGEAPQWPVADVLGMESEALMGPNVVDIPLDFQTRTIDPERPRTVGAGYDPDTQTMRIKFRPGASAQSPGGAVYDYYDISQKEYEALFRAISTGRYINNQLTDKPYVRRY